MIRDDNAPYGDELLVSIFAQFSPQHRKFRLVSESDIVDALYKARQTGEFDDLFVNYTFQKDGFGTRSRQLSEGLDTMQQSGLLGRMNPFLVNYSVSPAVDYRFDTFIAKKFEDTTRRNMLKKLAKLIKDEIHQQAVINEPSAAC